MFIDLTMQIDNDTPVFPGDPRQEISLISSLEEDGWMKRHLSFVSHFSTHIDAPIHRIPKGKALTDFPLEKFIGTCIVIDAEGVLEIEHDLEGVREGDIVFFHTGYTKRSGAKDFFDKGPIITKGTAHRLVEKKAKVVGIDSYSPDREPYPVHEILLSKDILIVENLVNLSCVAGKRFRCYILPLKIADADGAPCRVVAELED